MTSRVLPRNPADRLLSTAVLLALTTLLLLGAAESGLSAAPSGRPRPVALPGEDAELAQVFSRFQARGTMVLSSLDGRTRLVHGQQRATTRFIPASTFKIPNSLIALEEKAVVDEKQQIRWDGKNRGRSEWNQDHTLASALKVSCVWCYQKLARRVGADRYRSVLRRLHYGNATIGGKVTDFWLDGSLRISAEEQVEFLRRLKQRQLGFSARTYSIVERIMVAERGAGFVLRAKTGWSTESRPQLGWLVGILEARSGVWLFAMNLDLRSQDEAAKRWEITRAALKVKGLLPSPTARPRPDRRLVR